MSNTKKKHIAFIYEGVSAEDKLLTNLQKAYFSEFSDVYIFNLPAEGNVYMLWRKLVEDEFETNVIDILKEMSSEAKARIDEKSLKASQFSEIYLFFDYDGHAAQFGEESIQQADDLCKSLGMKEIKNKRDLLERMLDVFDNETEQGKLYISYPMVESIKEINVLNASYNRLYLMLDEIQEYKSSFGTQTDYGNYLTITKEMWNKACKASLKRASLIVRNTEQCTYKQFIQQVGQLEIYHAEKQYYINNPSGYYLAILNSIPLFLLEYFDEEFYEHCNCA